MEHKPACVNDSSVSDRSFRERKIGIIDYVLTYFAEGMTIVAGVLVYRFASTYLHTSGFSEYALARRTIALIQPVVMAGMSWAIVRQVAVSSAGRTEISGYTLFAGAALVIGLSHVLLLVMAALFPGVVSQILVGSSAFASLVVPIGVLTTGISLHLLATSYFRGLLKIGKANILQILNLGVVPVIVFPLFGSSTQSVLLWTGGLTSLNSLIVIFSIIIGEAQYPGRLREAIHSLMSYGLPRVPGDLAQMAILSLPSYLAAHFVDIEQAGVIAFGCTLLSLAGTAVSPLAIILLPQASRFLFDGRREEVRLQVNRFLMVLVPAVLVSLIIGEWLMPVFIQIYLGAAFTKWSNVVRVIALGAPGYLVFWLLRSIIDAAHHQATNARNCIIALALFLLGSWLLHPLVDGVYSLLFALVISINALGFLSLRDAHLILRRSF